MAYLIKLISLTLKFNFSNIFTILCYSDGDPEGMQLLIMQFQLEPLMV